MSYAALLYHYGWRKKKVNFIIPPTFFKIQSYSIAEKVSNSTYEASSTIIQIEDNHLKAESIAEKVSTTEVEVSKTLLKIEESETPQNETKISNGFTSTKVSAFSIKSIAIKKELAESQKSIVKDSIHLPVQEFTETEMLEQWYKYAQRLNDKGHMIMMSLLNITEPTLDGTTIIHELPNEGSKIDFEREMHELLGYLRGKLHNHEIKIEVRVNEAIEAKKAFTPQDKYNRMVEINPNLEILKKLFDLEL